MSLQKRPRIVKRSAGVACCRYNEARKCYEVLLVKKRCSYNFVAFVLGYYNKKDEKRVKFLFSGMTHAEKVDILSLKYAQLWYRVMLHYPDYTDINCDRMSKGDISTYVKKKNKFEAAFVSDGGNKLRYIINGTHNTELMWEIPKGRKCKNEMTLDCALREFREETNIRPSRFVMVTTINPITESYTNIGITYINKYYIAQTDMKNIPRINFSTNQQIAEITDIRWMNIADIKQIDPIGRLHKQITNVFKLFKTHRKKMRNTE